MSLLLGPRREVRADRPTSSLAELIRRREAPVEAGISVDAESARRHGAVFACIDLIGRLISTLPVHEFRREGEGIPHQLPDPPVLVAPDGELDLTAWLYQVIDSLLKRGNAYGLIQSFDMQGWPTQIKILDPSVVTASQRGRNGPVEWKLDGKPIQKWPAGELWHLPAYTVGGSPIGLSPISYGALTIGMGLAAQRFGAHWFRDGAVPSAVLTNEAEVNKSVAELAKQRWMDAIANTREPAVLGNGWKYEQVSVPPEESQFLDSIQANVADVARFFGVEPEEIGGTRAGGSSLVYQNVEAGQIHLLVRTINPWIVRLERALTALRPRPRFVKWNVDALLRVDTMTRHKAHESALRNGWRSVNEIRQVEDLPPIEEGDEFLWPPYRQQLNEEELLSDDSEDEEEVMPPPARVNGQQMPVGG